jgi:G:T-mismatch repair DNA endonuclease (very short patch repair protein)
MNNKIAKYPLGKNPKSHGNNKGMHHSEETKKIITDHRKNKGLGYIPKVPFKKGYIPWNKGKKGVTSDKSIEALKKYTKEHGSWSKGKKNPKVSNALTGRKLSEITRKKMSAGLKKAYADGIRKGIWVHDTRPERELREILKGIGIDFEEQKNLYGTPDFFIKPNICIFADGVYWHNYPNGSERDKEVNTILESQGYKILRFWETEIYSNKIEIKEKIINIMSEQRTLEEFEESNENKTPDELEME